MYRPTYCNSQLLVSRYLWLMKLFVLIEKLMRPYRDSYYSYKHTIFNHQLSRGRWVIEYWWCPVGFCRCVVDVCSDVSVERTASSDKSKHTSGTWRINPKDGQLTNTRCENLKIYNWIFFWTADWFRKHLILKTKFYGLIHHMLFINKIKFQSVLSFFYGLSSDTFDVETGMFPDQLSSWPRVRAPNNNWQQKRAQDPSSKQSDWTCLVWIGVSPLTDYSGGNPAAQVMVR